MILKNPKTHNGKKKIHEKYAQVAALFGDSKRGENSGPRPLNMVCH